MKSVVLAFSGGLDTSFCVPYLREQGYDVITLFADTGGVGPEGALQIERRALELGAVEHVTVQAESALWDEFVVPFVMGGAKYMDRYPLLCSDRYAIVAESVRLALARGADAVAHGCTAMGNDQVRFDQSIRALCSLPIVAPIREIQALTSAPRQYEAERLAEWGFSVSAEAKQYTVNENMLGVTVSGSEIDEFGTPGPGTYKLTSPPQAWPKEALEATIGFDGGVAVSLNGDAMPGPEILRTLNQAFGAYGVGRGIYTGDTIVGLKGRIVFECPGLEVLLAAHKALEEITLTKAVNEFKPFVARKWTELVFGGMFYEPLRADLEAFLVASQATVSGEVTMQTCGGSCLPVAVSTPYALTRKGAVYAQTSDWTATEAEGFIKLLGQSSSMGAAVRKGAAAR